MTYLISWLDSSREYFQQLGWLGLLGYALLFVVVQLFVAPVAPVAIGSGLIFGFGRGLLATTLGSAGGVAVNFLIARYLARKAIARRMERHPKFTLLDGAIARGGWKIVAMLRFVPMPFGLANYGYGLTAIPFWPYFLASVVAIAPGNFFFVWLGSTTGASMQSLTGSGRPRHPIEYVFLAAGLIGFFLALTYIGRLARAEIAKGQREAGSDEE